MSKKTQMTAVGIALMVAGVGLGLWGYQLSDSVGSQLKEAITGAYTDKVMMLYIGGAACFLVGFYLFSRKS